MGAGRSRIPKFGTNNKPVLLTPANPNCNNNANFLQPCYPITPKKPEDLIRPPTFEIKIPCPGN